MTDPTLVTTNNFDSVDIFNPEVSNGILYRGVGLSLTIYENNQVYGIAKGGPYTMSKRMDGSNQVVSVGNNIVLAAAVQGRNNARAIITGSLDMFSNELLKKSAGDNEKYINKLLSWAFQKSGVLRISHTMHKKVGSEEYNPSVYTTYDDLYFEAIIEEFDAQSLSWKPHQSDSIMISFQMLDPYWRIPMKLNSQGKYVAEFKVPEKPGVFQFKIDYSRPGYSFLKHSTKVTVRPFKHNEYPRFITQAYPYYLTVFATIAMFVVFLFAFIKQSN